MITLFAPHSPFAVAEPWFSLYDRSAMPPPLPLGMAKARFMTALRQESELDQTAPIVEASGQSSGA